MNDSDAPRSPGDTPEPGPFAEDERSLEPVNDGPGAVRPGQPTLLYDLATVVGAAYQLDIEPTVRDAIPRRVSAQLRPLLHGMPRVIPTASEDAYLDQVFRAARGLDLLQLSAPPGAERARYFPGPSLDTWAAASEAWQLGRFLAWWRSTLTWRDAWPTGWPTIGPGDRPVYPDTDTRARAALLATLARCLPERWYRVETVLYAAWRLQAAGPFEGERDWMRPIAAPRMDWENWRRRHAPRFLALLGSTLAETGAVSFAASIQTPTEAMPADVLPPDKLPDLVALTTLGADALSVIDATGAALTVNGQIDERSFVVQPTFEVVALRFASEDIYRLLRVTEVVRVGPTSAFRLTRQALLRGLAAGEQLDDLLNFLSHRGKKPLPQNVAYTLKDWARGYHEVRVSEVFLLEVSGKTAEEALRQTAADLRVDLREIAPGVFAARPNGPHAAFTGALRGRLEAAGVVVRAGSTNARANRATP